MLRFLKWVLTPTKLILVTAIVLGVGLAAGRINLAGKPVSAAICGDAVEKVEECQPIVDQTDAVDVCPNLQGLQVSIPSGYSKNANDECVQDTTVDVCPNLSGAQATVPSGYHYDGQRNCVQDPKPQVLAASTQLDPNK